MAISILTGHSSQLCKTHTSPGVYSKQFSLKNMIKINVIIQILKSNSRYILIKIQIFRHNGHPYNTGFTFF